VVVFWTANSLESDEVKDEAAIAKRQRKLLPIQLDHIVDEKKLPLGHGQLQLAKLHSWNGDVNDAGVITEGAIESKNMNDLGYSVHKYLYRRLRSAGYVQGELPGLTFEDMRRGLIYFSKR
jgi:hypothetical protein